MIIRTDLYGKTNEYVQKKEGSVTNVNNSFATELDRAKMEQVIRDRIEYLADKIKDGDTEVTYPIGAGSFTEREWTKLIEKYDAIQEEMKEMMQEEEEKRKEKELIKDKEEKKEC